MGYLTGKSFEDTGTTVTSEVHSLVSLSYNKSGGKGEADSPGKQ